MRDQIRELKRAVDGSDPIKQNKARAEQPISYRKNKRPPAKSPTAAEHG